MQLSKDSVLRNNRSINLCYDRTKFVFGQVYSFKDYVDLAEYNDKFKYIVVTSQNDLESIPEFSHDNLLFF